MLTNWTVGNFKSIDEPITVPLGPVTLISGVNSSGKTAFLQSILVAAQTISSRSVDRPLVTNGRFVRLGMATELVHVPTQSTPLVLGGTLRGEWNEAPAEFEFKANIRVPRRSSGLRREEVVYGAELSASLGSRIFRVQSTSQLTAKISPRVSDRSWRAVTSFSAPPLEGKARGVILRQFLPTRLAMEVDPLERALSMLSGRSPRRKGFALVPFEDLLLVLESFGINTREPLTDEAARRIGNILSRHNVSARLPSTLEEVFNRLRVSWRRLGIQAQDELFQAVRSLALAQVSELRSSEMDITDLPEPLRTANREIRDFFETRVRYIGPLREDPRSVYGMEHPGEIDDVGVKGEFTAAVLDQLWARSVSNPDPLSRSVRQERLLDATIRWLRHLGLASSLETEELGSMGFQISVTIGDDGKWHDLTNVGVGVSQVLPIIVSALLSPANSLLIFEQPEIHLHPAVQSRLAEFFVGLARHGKQCLIETHSEHLMNRLRLLIAEDESGDTSDLIKMYFAQLRDGESHFSEVAVSPAGSIQDWPAGFFDETLVQSQRLLEAGARRRALSASKEK